MNKEYVNKMSILNKENKRFAFVSITEANGSSPAKVGQNMIVLEDGTITGTCGGGLIEKNIIDLSISALEIGKSKSFDYDLTKIGMSCGGNVKGFIQVQSTDNNIIIIGGGHVGKKLYDITRHLQFNITIVDDREDFACIERFPDCNVVYCSYNSITDFVDIDKHTYVVIATSGHKSDLIALEQALSKSPKYIGMIGSRRKVNEIITSVKNNGITNEMLNNVYAPIGLDIASQEVGEIAISILSEILLIKNNGDLRHLKAF